MPRKEGVIRSVINWATGSSAVEQNPQAFSGSIVFAPQNIEPVSFRTTTFRLNPEDWAQGGRTLRATNSVGLDAITVKFLQDNGYAPEIEEMVVPMKGDTDRENLTMLHGTSESEEFVMAFTIRAQNDPNLLTSPSLTVTESMMALVRPVIQLEDEQNRLQVLERQVQKRIEMIILRPAPTFMVPIPGLEDKRAA